MAYSVVIPIAMLSNIVTALDFLSLGAFSVRGISPASLALVELATTVSRLQISGKSARDRAYGCPSYVVAGRWVAPGTTP
eukprot:scaffold172347_cov50-Prasinocladus_malaysianus.AAC.1